MESNANTIAVLNHCRARSRALYDIKTQAFLGTSTLVGPSTFLTCLHCVGDRTAVAVDDCHLEVHFRMPSADLALLKSKELQNASPFVASSDDICLGDPVIVYGFRRRDGSVRDVVYFCDVGSINERALADGLRPHLLCGLGRRDLFEPGMSGGAVLNASTLELLGYIVGYDRLQETGRKDDAFVVLSNAVVQDEEIRAQFVFGHQRRAVLINLARRYMSFLGYTASVESLGEEPGLHECLLCVRGTGFATHSILVVTASSRQMRSVVEVKNLYELSKQRASSRGLVFDKACIILEEDLQNVEIRAFTVTAHDLVRLPGLREDSDSRQLVVKRFLTRLVLPEGESSPLPAIDAIENALAAKIRVLAIAGPIDSGKRTLIEKFATSIEARTLSGERNLRTIIRLNPLNASQGRSFPLKQISEPSLVILTSFEPFSLTLDGSSALRDLRVILATMNDSKVDWTLLIPVDAGIDQAKRMLNVLANDLIERERLSAMEILPLTPDLVRETLRVDIGSSDGEALWKIIVSSQEIFQIAQWPGGLSLILNRVVRGALGSNKLTQVQIIATVVNGYLSRDNRGLPPSVTFAFLISLSKEINATQRIHVAIEKARRIYAAAAPEVHVIHAIAVTDIVVPGLLSLSVDSETVFFESPIFLHYFLALGITKCIQGEDVSQQNPLYHRRIPVALLKDVVDLGIEPDRLWALIKSTTKRDAGGTGFIGGNCISLLRLSQVDFRNADFSDCDLRGAIFTKCDLSGANFTNAVLADASFSNAILESVNLSNADLQRADLKAGCTVYQLVNGGRYTYAATSLRRLVRIDHELFNVTDIPGFTDSVFCAALSPDKTILLAGGQDGTIRGLECHNSEPKFVLRGHFSDIRALLFVGKCVISGAVDGRVNLWSPWSATLLRSFNICGHQIWSLVAIDSQRIAILCDKGHLHIGSISDLPNTVSYSLPSGYSRTVTWDNESKSLIVGGEQWVWILDIESKISRTIPVPHPSIRAVIRAGEDEFLIGGAYGIILSANGSFTEMQSVCKSGEDYVSALTQLPDNKVVVGNARGRVSILERRGSEWTEVRTLNLLSGPIGAYARQADFRFVKNVPTERLARLAEAGAIIK